MKKFVDVTIKPVLIIGGLGTAAAFLYAFFPQFALANVAKLDFVQDNIIFVRHWGIMVGFMGAFMVAAAFIESWRTPIMLYGLLEKAFLVYLVATNASFEFARGFYVPAGMDAIITVYSIVYFVSLKKG